MNASLNCALTGGAARKPAGDVPAEEPVAAGGEQLAQRKTPQPGEVRMHTHTQTFIFPSQDFLHILQPADVCVMC